MLRSNKVCFSANHDIIDETKKKIIAKRDKRGLEPGFVSKACKKDMHGDKCPVTRCSCHCHNPYSGRKGEK